MRNRLYYVARRRMTRGVLYALAACLAIFALLPLYWMAISAFKTPKEFGAMPPTWWPQETTFLAFERATTLVPFFQAFLNSLLIASVCTASVLFTSVMAGYVFAKYHFRGKNALFWITVATMFLPPIVTLVPLYHIVSSLGLANTFLGVMLPWLANAFGIFLMRQFLLDFPDELLEAARLDGASEFRILFRLVVPLLKPALVTLAIFAFVFDWNAFIWPLSVLSSESKHPIVLALNSLSSVAMSVEYRNVILAGSLLASLPTILLFFVFQRVFVQGMARSGIR